MHKLVRPVGFGVHIAREVNDMVIEFNRNRFGAVTAIEFIELDENHIAIKTNWGNMHVRSGLITHSKDLVLFEGHYTIEHMEVILAKMKELQGV